VIPAIPLLLAGALAAASDSTPLDSARRLLLLNQYEEAMQELIALDRFDLALKIAKRLSSRVVRTEPPLPQQFFTIHLVRDPQPFLSVKSVSKNRKILKEPIPNSVANFLYMDYRLIDRRVGSWIPEDTLRDFQFLFLLSKHVSVSNLRAAEGGLRFEISMDVPKQVLKTPDFKMDFDKATYVGDGTDGAYYDVKKNSAGWWLWIVIDSDTGGFVQEHYPYPDGPYESQKKAREAGNDAARDWCSENDVIPDDPTGAP
jgi:hypothetical protein